MTEMMEHHRLSNQSRWMRNDVIAHHIDIYSNSCSSHVRLSSNATDIAA